MRRILITLLSVFVSILVIVGIAITLFLGSLQDVVETQGSDRLGRKFAIEGPLDIDWNWSAPRITAQKLKLANMEGMADPYMLEIDEVSFTIKVWKLLYGRTELPDVHIENAKIILEMTDEDHKNWDFPVLSKGGTVTDAVVPDDRFNFPIIGNLTIKGSQLIYRNAAKSLNVNLQLDTAESESDKGNNRLTVNGTGTLQKKDFDISASSGSLQMLRDTSKLFPINLDIKMGQTHIEFVGTLKDPVTLQGVDATLNLKGPTLSDLFYLTGIPLPPTPPYALNGQLGKDGNIWSYKEFKGKVGDSDLGGNLTYDISGDRGFVKANLVSRKIDMDDLGGFIGLSPSTDRGETASAEQIAQAKKDAASPRLLPNIPIDLGRLRSADMDVTLKVDKLNAPSLPFHGMDVHLKLDNGLLTFEPMKLILADGTLTGSLILDGREEIPFVTTDFDLRRLRLNRFFEGTRFEAESSGTFGGHIALKGKGKSLAEVMATSNGQVIVLMAGGKISLLLIEAADLDLAEATPLLLGEDKSTRIRCGLGDFKVNDGVLNSQTFVLDTNDSKLKGRVDIDLKNETINARLDVAPKDMSLLSIQSPIVISGPLKKPSIGLEPVATGVRAATATAFGIVLTPFAAFLPFIGVETGTDSDCTALIAHGKEEMK